LFNDNFKEEEESFIEPPWK